ncbi:cellulose biosynthesis cyclic di-GMP-binding regulatory protein BcsB [Sulfoacidibacillus ferrooxidans]|uniref:Cellulose synthase regulatory subunit n=1 Tax=Sulfoacidibacillus ferrooxidans TaxID=2005001 RepID=A0A9X1VBT3_9BACL|nr:cellulose biosynthesis cyclic di-GMP-binding regulatory protein BcsB [Sulfoacidibacillus ferrooxidans]MCI0184860.1 hypothetical protein [Sulfoacidibacillus ferrooxidans]
MVHAKKIMWLTWLITLSALMMPGSAWASTPISTSTYTVSPQWETVHMMTTDEKLTPRNASYDFFLDVPNESHISSCQFTIFYRHSPTLIPEESNLLLEVDGIPYATTILTSSDSENGYLSARIPASQLTPGYHEFSVAVQLNSNVVLCNNYNSADNWFVLLDSSFLHFNYASNKKLPDLSQFPFPMLLPFGHSQWNTRVVVPQSASDMNLTAAFTAIQTLAEDAKSIQPESVHVETTRTLHLTSVEPFVYVGPFKTMPSLLRNTFPSQFKWVPNEGLLREVILSDPRTHHQVLGFIITGENDHDVLLAARALRYPWLMRQMSGNTSWVTLHEVSTAKNQVVHSVVVRGIPRTQHVSLSQLGYNSTILEGKQQETALFTLPTPTTWRLGPGAGLHLDMKNSALLDSSSAVIISVNGSPVLSHRLSDVTANGLRLFVPFPHGLSTGEPVTVAVMVEMFLPRNNCSENSGDLRRYVTIDPDSWFDLPHYNESSSNLSDFPNAYLDNQSDLEPTTVIVPNHPTSDELTALARILVGYVPRIRGGSLLIKKDDDRPIPHGNVWVLDVDGSNAAARYLEDRHTLPIKDENGLLSSTSLPLAYNVEKTGGVVEQAYRPTGGMALLVTAPTENSLLRVSDMFASHVALNTPGSVAIETNENQTVILNYMSKPYESLSTQWLKWLAVNYEFLITNGGQGIVYLVAFILSVGSVLTYLGWNLLRRKPHWKNRLRFWKKRK